MARAIGRTKGIKSYHNCSITNKCRRHAVKIMNYYMNKDLLFKNLLDHPEYQTPVAEKKLLMK